MLLPGMGTAGAVGSAPGSSSGLFCPKGSWGPQSFSISEPCWEEMRVTTEMSLEKSRSDCNHPLEDEHW